jgi:lipid A oxidase
MVITAPMRTFAGMRRTACLGLLGAMVAWGGAARAETTLTLYVGVSFHHDSKVRVRQPGGTDLTYRDISWTSRSLELPLYYGVRLTHHFEARRDWGVMLDFFHDKAYADTAKAVGVTGTRGGEPVEGTEPLGTTVQSFNMSHGMNYLTLDVVHRWNTCPEPGCTARLQPYVGAGAGLVIPHVEARVGDASVGEYQVRGPAFQVLGGVAWPFASRFSLSGEYRFTHTSPTVDVPGGTVETTLNTHHLIAGPSFRLPGL